jgi:hypothetical protein
MSLTTVQRLPQGAARGVVGRPASRRARAIRVEERPGLHASVDPAGALDQRLDELDGRDLLAADRAGRLRETELVQTHGAGSA